MNPLRLLVIAPRVANPKALETCPWDDLGPGIAVDKAYVDLPEQCSDWYKVLPAVATTLRHLPKLNSYDAVLSSSAANGIFLALLQTLLPRRLLRPAHVMIDVGSTLVLHGAGPVMLRTVRWLFSSVRAIVSYADSSVRFWKEKAGSACACVFIPLPVSQEIFKGVADRDEGYILSAGRFGRDYPTLLRAVKGLSIPLVIVGDDENYALVRELLSPAGTVTYYNEIPFDRYLGLLSKARLVVLPMRDTAYHAGQTVLIQAMALGKAVITSRTNGTVNYVTDGADGLLVEPGDADALRARILRLIDAPDEARRLGERAREKALREFSEQALKTKIAAIIHTAVKGNAE